MPALRAPPPPPARRTSDRGTGAPEGRSGPPRPELPTAGSTRSSFGRTGTTPPARRAAPRGRPHAEGLSGAASNTSRYPVSQATTPPAMAVEAGHVAGRCLVAAVPDEHASGVMGSITQLRSADDLAECGETKHVRLTGVEGVLVDYLDQSRRQRSPVTGTRRLEGWRGWQWHDPTSRPPSSRSPCLHRRFLPSRRHGHCRHRASTLSPPPSPHAR